MPKSCAQSSSTRNAPCARTTSRTCSPRSGRPLRAGGVGVVRLRVEQPRAGLVEGPGQLLRVRAVGAARHRDDADAGLRRRQDRAPVGRRLHQQRLPAADQCAEDGAEPALAAGEHDRRRSALAAVTPAGVDGAEFVREPGLQLGQAGGGRPGQGRVAAGCPGRARPAPAARAGVRGPGSRSGRR